MKKVILFFGVLVFLFLLLVYIFIPNTIRISNIVTIECTPRGAAAVLQNYEKWKSWWPQSNDSLPPDSSFSYKDYHYKLITPLTDGADIDLYKKARPDEPGGQGNHLSTRIQVVSSGRDSVYLAWSANIITGHNPFKRLAQFFEARTIKNNMEEVLQNLGAFAGKTENIYGFTIERTTFTDTVLIATKFSTEAYPTIETIYKAITRLKGKIKDAGAEEKDFPMLNVKKNDDNARYETMIAICINKEIKVDPDDFISLMVPMKDRFLKADVTGGPLTVKKAHEAIGNYMNDHFLSAPAIPFDILITDRSKEADTAKWRTRVFHPSM